MKIVLTGGGTGGHIFPILSVARALKEEIGEKEDLELLFLGTEGELEKEVMEKELIPAKKIVSGKFRRYFSVQNFIDVFKIPVGIIQSLFRLLAFMPDAIFAKGGFACVPVAIAAYIYRIPILIHESDVMPGLANQILSRLAARVAISFPESLSFFSEKKTFLSGNPIRKELTEGNREEAMKKFSLSPDKKTILIIGGSQGSRAINHAVIGILKRLLKSYQIIHIIGKGEYESVIHQVGELGIKAGHEGYIAVPFLGEELPHVFALADLIISRAGANVMTEIAANAKPSILIPLDGAANNHQEQNAFVFSQAGAAITLEQNNLGENILFEKIEEILGNEELRFEMSQRVKKFYNPEAARVIADELINLSR
ncbi:MAG: undecaprenyldiphospho-muramoylpentapeptide beta-N-acetylglucosaminyltransferase [Parcubacteria group bacterium]|jgi:UDP-N-acetylglucosamine--N-acetylmuramyl-(pentapeptide) pyrophosphoryl-undecaprenol N-acetylglucosamine transferase